MKKIYILGFVTLLSAVFLNACILSENPVENNIVMHPGELKVFSVNVGSGTTSINWYIDGVHVSEGFQSSLNVSFSESDIGDHVLRVTTHMQGNFPDAHTWNIKVAPPNTSTDMLFRISVEKNAHDTYGLSYPLTYKFKLPENVSNVCVYRKWREEDPWVQMDEKRGADFYNGITAARFNYISGIAYISIPFNTVSDVIYLDFRDAEGETLPDVVFMEISEYYDGRKAVVTSTLDDWSDSGNEQFKLTCNKYRQRKIWVSPGIITGTVSAGTWNDIQAQVDDGYVEPVSHSRNHLDKLTFCVLAADEIGGSSLDLKSNLDLPFFNRRGDNEFVYAYLEPYSLSCDLTRMQIGKNQYLIDRNSAPDVSVWATWDGTNGCYSKIGFTKRMGTDAEQDLSVLNASFNTVYEAGGIYHLTCHPWALGTDEWEAYGDPHLDYIKEKLDVWYVAFGHLYVYHYMQERGVISVTIEEK